MDALRDVVSSILAIIRDRFLNPLYLSYAIAWAALNYRLLVVLAGEGAAKAKFEFIDSALYPEFFAALWRGALMPAVLATLYVLISPHVYRWVRLYIRVQAKKTAEEEFRVLEETPVSPETLRRLYKTLAESRTSHAEEVDRLNNEIESLRTQLESLSLQKSSAQPQPQVLPEQEEEEEEEAYEPDALGETNGLSSHIQTGEKQVVRIVIPAHDRIGFSAQQIVMLKDRGLKQLELRVLQSLSESSRLTLDDFRSRVGMSSYTISAMVSALDFLVRIELVKRDMNVRSEPVFTMSSLGHRVLAHIEEQKNEAQ